jgi:predicted DNA-binding transcriptional regulator YafY
VKAIEQIERLKRMDELIKTKSTGNPEEFAEKLSISQSHLFNLINELKTRDAPIRYNPTRKTYYYTEEYNLKI